MDYYYCYRTAITTTKRFSVLLAMASKNPEEPTIRETPTPSKTQTNVDWDALRKYGIAALVQMGLFYAIGWGLDAIVRTSGRTVPFGINCLLFYACSLKSRIFNPLSNQRPKPSSIDSNNTTTIRPSWTPPGIFFPIMWLLIIGPLRAYSASLLYHTSTRSYVHYATMSFFFHLTMGDIWNTINNVERRVGASASAVWIVLLSAIYASYQYYVVHPLAGQLLSITTIWLSIAATLVHTIRRLNPIDATTGELDVWYPQVQRQDGEESVRTKFVWFQKKRNHEHNMSPSQT